MQAGFDETWGIRASGSNPCLRIERYHEKHRERFLSPTELKCLGDAVRTAEKSGEISAPVAAAIRLLVFTGARLSEILGLEWGQIDWNRCEARLGDSKTGPKTIHLPPPAMAVLKDMPRLNGNPFVIFGQRPGSALVNLEKPWRKVRKIAGLGDVRIHDLRHSFASTAAASGMALPIIGKMLGHSQPQTTARYAHLADDPVKSAATSVAGHIAAAFSSTADADVVPLARTNSQ